MKPCGSGQEEPNASQRVGPDHEVFTRVAGEYAMPVSFAAELRQAAEAAGAGDAIAHVLDRWAGQRVYIPINSRVANRAAELARRLVFAGVGTGAAAALVRDRFELSARHARRLVRAAVDMRGQSMAASQVKMKP